MAFIALSMAASSIGYASGDVFPAVGRPGLLIKIVAPTTAVKVVGLLLAAPYGLTAMAATACGLSAVFATIRLLVVDRLLGLRLTTSLEAMSPGLVAAAGAALGALPVVLLRPAGVVTLVGAVAAGVLGAVALLVLLRRAALRDLWQLVGAMRPRRSADGAADAR
jgi:PST family polysaccharide transporter